MKLRPLHFIGLFLVLSLLTCEKFTRSIAVKTGTTSNLTATSATISGTIIDVANGITAHGHCWSKTNTNPTPENCDAKTDLGTKSASGDFTSNLSNLKAGTTYYVAAYAKSKDENVTGKVITFNTTTATVPVITTIAGSAITQTTALSGGDITSDGNSPVTARGVCWKTSSGPTIASSSTSDGSGTGTFTSSISGLAPNIKYYVRAYATNSVGTAYGNEVNFTTAAASAPTVTSSTVTNLTPTSVTLNGSVNANGASTTVTFEYGTTITYGSTATATQSPVTGSANTSVSSNITSLTANTLYHYRIKAVNSVGTTNTNDNTFSTPIVPSTETDFTVFSFNTPFTIGTINTTNHTVAIAVPYGTNVTALIASFTLSTGATVKVGTTSQVSGTTPNNFTNPVTYNVTAQDGVTSQAWTVTVTIAPNNTANFLTFNFSSPAVIGIINTSNRTVSLTVPYGTNVTALIATFTLSSGTVKVGTTAQVSGTTANNFTNPVNYTITAQDGITSQVWSVTVTVALNNATDFLTFGISSPAANGTVNTTNHTVTISVPDGTNLSSLIASFTFSAGATVKIGSTAQNSGITANNFISPVNYTVTAQDGITAQTWTVTVSMPASAMDMDGNVYTNVTIGTQVWMKENLKTTKNNDGTSIPNTTDNLSWAALSTASYCWYNNDQATYKATYGALYNWHAVNTGKICPSGWHVPSDTEWKTLEMYIGLTQTQADATGWRGSGQGNQLKETGTTHWLSPSAGTNSRGFLALPGGQRNYVDGTFSNITQTGNWWSGTENSSTAAWYRILTYNNTGISRVNDLKKFGFSVRCIKD